MYVIAHTLTQGKTNVVNLHYIDLEKIKPDEKIMNTIMDIIDTMRYVEDPPYFYVSNFSNQFNNSYQIKISLYPLRTSDQNNPNIHLQYGYNDSIIGYCYYKKIYTIVTGKSKLIDSCKIESKNKKFRISILNEPIFDGSPYKWTCIITDNKISWVSFYDGFVTLKYIKKGRIRKNLIKF